MSEASREKIYGVDASERHTKILEVRVIRATDLQRLDFLGGLCDPYVKLSLQVKDSRNAVMEPIRTRTVPKTLNPYWNQEFLIRVRSSLLYRTKKRFDEYKFRLG